LASDGGDEAGRQHAVGDAAAEHRALGVFLVEVGRIDVGGNAGEQDDVGFGDGLGVLADMPGCSWSM
jgi:hypothetical protein